MSDIDEVKSRLSIVDIIGVRVTLKKVGRHFKALCPFHNEKTPSFIVSPERQIWKCFGCFPPGELVRTPFGFHEIETIDTNHWVISGKGSFQKVVKTMNRHYQGVLMQIRLRKLGYPVRLTSDHKVLVIRGGSIGRKYKSVSHRMGEYRKRYIQDDEYASMISRDFPIEEISSGELQKGDLLLYPIRKEIRDVERIDLSEYITKFPKRGIKPRAIPLNIPINQKLLEFIGYYIAEGSRHRAYLRFSLSSHEQQFARKLKILAKQLFGLTATIHERRFNGKTGLEVTICHSQLANIFENLCGQSSVFKHIPWIFQELPLEKQKTILVAIFRGDGYLFHAHRSTHYHKAITTVSKVLAEQLTDILLRLNRFPGVYIEKSKVDKKNVHHKQVYRVFWSETAAQRYDLIYPRIDGGSYWVLPIVEISKQMYQGPVYNLTVGRDHSYTTASFAVANCGKGGSVIDFVMEYEHMDFVEALEELADKAGVKLERRNAETPEAKHKQELYAVNHLASEYYQYILTKHALGEKARQYLKHRGVTDRAIKTFTLGYSPNSWDALGKFLRKKGYEPRLLEQAGLLVASPRGGYDRFRGRVIFTLRDHRGNVVGFSGRLLDPEAKEAKYINTSDTPVYNKSAVLYGLDVTREAIQKANEAILMEGEFDVISSFQAGISNVIAIKGSALTEGHVNLLRRFTERIVFALDSDVAGDTASRRGIEIADRAGLDMRVLTLPGGKDPDSAVRGNPGLVKKAIAQAVPIYDYFIASALKRFDLQTPFGKRKISDELLPLLGGIENVIVQSHYIKKLAGVLDTSIEAVSEGIAKAVKATQRKSDSTPQTREVTESRSEKLALYIGALILQGETRPWYEELVTEVNLADINHPAIPKLLVFLGTYLSGHKEFSVKSLATVLPTELVSTLDEAFLLDIGASLEGKERRILEWQRALRELRRDILHRKIKILTSQVGESPQAELVELSAALKHLENPG